MVYAVDSDVAFVPLIPNNTVGVAANAGYADLVQVTGCCCAVLVDLKRALFRSSSSRLLS